jgi:hypothetical protein
MDLLIDNGDSIVAVSASGAVKGPNAPGYTFDTPSIGFTAVQIERKTGKALFTNSALYGKPADYSRGICKLSADGPSGK